MDKGKPAMPPRLALALGVLGVSLSSILVRFAAAPSLVTATYRLGWAVLLLTPVVLLRHRGELRGLALKDVLLCFASGALLAGHFATWFESLKRTTVASSTVLVCTEVLFAALGYRLFLKGRLPKGGVPAIGVAFIGAVIIAVGGSGTGGGSLAGDLLALAGAVFVAGYTLIGRVQRGHLSTTVYTWLTYCGCTLTLLGVDLATGTPLTGWPVRELLIGLALGVVCTLMGHSVFSWCLKYLDPAFVSTAKLCEPVIASLLALLLFREVPGPWQLAGAAVLLAGVVWYGRAEQKRPVQIDKAG